MLPLLSCNAPRLAFQLKFLHLQRPLPPFLPSFHPLLSFPTRNNNKEGEKGNYCRAGPSTKPGRRRRRREGERKNKRPNFVPATNSVALSLPRSLAHLFIRSFVRSLAGSCRPWAAPAPVVRPSARPSVSPFLHFCKECHSICLTPPPPPERLPCLHVCLPCAIARRLASYFLLFVPSPEPKVSPNQLLSDPNAKTYAFQSNPCFVWLSLFVVEQPRFVAVGGERTLATLKTL